MNKPTLTPDEALRKAGKLAARGDAARAATLLNAVLQRDPGNKKARKALRALQANTRAALSEADFQRVRQLMRPGSYDAARSEVRRLCRLHPEQPALHNLRGAILARLGDTEDAVRAFRTALEQEPRYSEALGNLACVLTDREQHDEALACYRELAQRRHLDADGYIGLGRALRAARRFEEAADAYRRSIALRPINVDAYNNLGNTLNELGRHQEAIEAYESALGIDAGHRETLLNYAQSLLGLGRLHAALSMFTDYLKLEPRNTTALRGLAGVLMTLKQRTAAAERYEELLRIDPDDRVARHMLAALSHRPVPQEADPAYARAVFEGYAARFEKHLTQTLEYRLPERIPELLQALDGEDAWYDRALDIGCGTGLVGAQIRSFCSELVGIDIAAAMLAKAQEKAVYDELLVDDVSSWLARTPTRFDLILVAEVVIYIGALNAFLEACFSHTRPGGRLLLSTEQIAEGRYTLRDSGRYAHSAAYVNEQAAKAGYGVASTHTVNLRKEAGEWLEGGVFILTRPA